MEEWSARLWSTRVSDTWGLTRCLGLYHRWCTGNDGSVALAVGDKTGISGVFGSQKCGRCSYWRILVCRLLSVDTMVARDDSRYASFEAGTVHPSSIGTGEGHPIISFMITIVSFAILSPSIYMHRQGGLLRKCDDDMKAVVDDSIRAQCH